LMTRKASAALLVILAASIVSAYAFETGLGAVSLERVSFPNGEHTVAGTLYMPKTGTAPMPGVVLGHGISNSREPMSGIALELARSGVAALAIDLEGHGASGGALGGGDSSLGVLAALDYLESHPLVDEERLGLVGHSLGAGAVRYAALIHGGIKAVVLIGGGVSGGSWGGGSINSTFPRNLLVAVGRQDVLFDYNLAEGLNTAFNVTNVEPMVTYGAPEAGTARRLVTPDTIHLLEPINPTIVKESVDWLTLTLGGSAAAGYLYTWRELALTAFFVAFHGLVLLFLKRGSEIRGDQGVLGLGEGALFGLMGIILFLPSMLLGTLINFPPLIFGSSMAWWLLLWGTASLAILSIRSHGNPWPLVRSGFSSGDVKTGLAVFAAMYLAVTLVEAATGFQLRLLVPIFRSLTFRRALLAPTFIPFFALFFASENAYFSGYNGLLGLLLSKTGPILVLLLAQYGAMFLVSVRIVPGFAAFIVEFLWAIVPLLWLSTAYTWRLRGQEKPWIAVTLNTLLFSWACAGLFPFGGA
jgi:dienelactone hydrolase